MAILDEEENYYHPGLVAHAARALGMSLVAPLPSFVVSTEQPHQPLYWFDDGKDRRVQWSRTCDRRSWRWTQRRQRTMRGRFKGSPAAKRATRRGGNPAKVKWGYA